MAPNIQFPQTNAKISALSGTPMGLQQNYNQAANNTTKFNEDLANRILAGYQDTLANQKTQQQAISQGYSNLSKNIGGKLAASQKDALRGFQTGSQQVAAGYDTLQNQIAQQLQGANASQIADINANYKTLQGKQLIDMQNRGLGNSTVALNAEAGLNSLQNRDILASQGAQQKMLADYASQIGMAKQGYAGQAVAANADMKNNMGLNQANLATNIGLKSLDFQNAANTQNTTESNLSNAFLNTITAKMPDPTQYGNLINQQGQMGMALANGLFGGNGTQQQNGTGNGNNQSNPYGTLSSLVGNVVGGIGKFFGL